MTTELKIIPLNRLIVSPLNARRTDRKADLAALAASIESHGLLQNLAVTDVGDGKFAVVAGGRRLAAMKMLAKAGGVAKDHPVPCQVVDAGAGAEASLVENVHRVAMDVMDEVAAFAALSHEQHSTDEIARRFGVTRRHVEQRLALACLSPKIKAAWKRGEISLDAARAFCLVDDHARQDAVFRSLGKPVTHAASVRARLMEGRMRASDRLVKFVGLEAYDAAGGAIIRDLFEEDAVFIEDPALMVTLAEGKLEVRREELAALGWGWTEVNLGNVRSEGVSAGRLAPEWRDPTPSEQAELDRLQAALDAIDAALDLDSTEDDPRWTERDDLAAEFETLRQSMRVWNKALMPFSGVILSVCHDGGVSETPGVIRQADEKAVRTIRQKASAQLQEPTDMSGTEAGAYKPEVTNLPKAVIRQLSTERTRALRILVASNPHVALALTVASMASEAFRQSALDGVAIGAHPARLDDLDELASLRSAAEASLAEEDLLNWCLTQTEPALTALLAVLVSGAIDLTHECGCRTDRSKQGIADTLATAVALDMTKFWTADIDYWLRLPKAELLLALELAPSISDRPPSERSNIIKAHAKLKKEELAGRVAVLWEGGSYLPDMLVTAVAEGALELTASGLAAAA